MNNKQYCAIDWMSARDVFPRSQGGAVGCPAAEWFSGGRSARIGQRYLNIQFA
jgi:hypothetical protein